MPDRTLRREKISSANNQPADRRAMVAPASHDDQALCCAEEAIPDMPIKRDGPVEHYPAHAAVPTRNRWIPASDDMLRFTLNASIRRN